VKSVREWCDPDAWTAEVQLKKGALPDLDAWDKDFRGFVGESMTIRGVEVTVIGTLVEVDSKPNLRIEGGKTLKLAPLEHKVEWDPKRKTEQQATTEEREAHRRLINSSAPKRGRSTKIKVTGPLKRSTSKGEPPTLTVRAFAAVKP
jgi:hypothetical protein